jgi:hypothetical protein
MAALVAHGSRACNYSQLLGRQTRQRRDDFIRHGITEVFARRITAQIGKGKRHQPGSLSTK